MSLKEGITVNAKSNTNPSRPRLGARVMAMGRSSFHDCGLRDLGSRGEGIKLTKQGNGGLDGPLALLVAGIHGPMVTSETKLKLELCCLHHFH